MFGLPAVATDMTDLAEGRLGHRGVVRLRERLTVVRGRGACAHPDGAARLAQSALHVFAEDAAQHARGVPCAWTSAPTWLPGEI